MKKRISRRTFLGQAAATGVALQAMGQQTLPAQAAVKGANERVNLGLIGCGQRGGQLLEIALQSDDVAIPIVCDVDAKRAAEAAERVAKVRGKHPAVVGDFHEILELKDIDGVIIATPDHWHAIQLSYACLAGKDAYVETPISHNIVESHVMTFATRKYNRVVQVGLQQRSGAWFEEAVKKIRSRELGRIAQTRSWSFAKVKPIAKTPDSQPPSHLDYDRWLGPAPKRAYNPNRLHINFVNWWDYAGGMMNKWNTHLQDIMNWAMRVNVPKSVAVVGGNYGLRDFRETPDTLEAVFEYESVRGPFMHVCSLRLSNGHAAWGPPIPRHNGQMSEGVSRHYGTQFHGDKATLFVDRDRLEVFPADHQQPKPLTVSPQGQASMLIDPLTLSHFQDFVSCVRSRNLPRAVIHAGLYAALPGQLANIAYRLGRKLYFNPQTSKLREQCYQDREHKIPDTEANKLLEREYRKPYIMPRV